MQVHKKGACTIPTSYHKMNPIQTPLATIIEVRAVLDTKQALL